MQAHLFDQMLGTGLVLLLAVYGGFVDPTINAWFRLVVRVGAGLAVLWMVILVIVAATPNHHA
jgi:hypothetical protein